MIPRRLSENYEAGRARKLMIDMTAELGRLRTEVAEARLLLRENLALRRLVEPLQERVAQLESKLHAHKR